MKILAIANQKGGVAKTTSAINIGHALALRGKRVLLIDLDPQASLTVSLGFDPDSYELTIYDALKTETDLANVIIERAPFDYVPANLEMADADLNLGGKTGHEFRLAEALSSVSRKYDYCLLDCPPGLGVLTLNAFVSANSILLPISADYLATRGTKQLLNIYDDVKKYYNKGLKIGGAFVTRFEGQTVLAREVLEYVADEFKGATFKTIIRKNVALAEAPAQGKTIFEYEPKSNGAIDYKALTDEILKVK